MTPLRAPSCRLAAGLATAALVLTACSDGGGGAAAPEVDPKQAYVDAASEVCTSAVEDFAGLTPPSAPADFAPYVEQTVEIVEGAQRDLAALTPPEQDRAELESKVLDPFAELVEQGTAWGEQVVAAGNDQTVLLGLLSQRPDSTGIDREFLRSYGLDPCAEAVSLVG